MASALGKSIFGFSFVSWSDIPHSSFFPLSFQSLFQQFILQSRTTPSTATARCHDNRRKPTTHPIPEYPRAAGNVSRFGCTYTGATNYLFRGEEGAARLLTQCGDFSIVFDSPAVSSFHCSPSCPCRRFATLCASGFPLTSLEDTMGP